MKDLSKEKRLEQRILEMADACGDKKWLRVKRTFFVLCGVIYLMLLYIGVKNGIDISNIDIKTLFYLIFCLTFGVGFVAGAIMFISYGILFYIINGATEDEKAIAKLEGELNAIKLSKQEVKQNEKD